MSTFDNSGEVPLNVPGFNTPLTWEAVPEDRFAHGVNDFKQQRLVQVEIAMLAVMDGITDKPGWQEKVFNEAIVEMWRAEATALPLISPEAWDWILRELRDETDFLRDHKFVKTLNSGSPCAKADSLIEPALRDELLAGVRPLLEVDDKVKDWHPNSNEQVLNLVHPSLFPLVYGRTHVLRSGRVGLIDCLDYCGKGILAPEQTLENDDSFSARFQWLPAEVKFKPEAAAPTDVEFASYINNLHPVHHKDLYSTISKIISKAIPMWNEVLVKGYSSRTPPRIVTTSADYASDKPDDLQDFPGSRDDEGFEEAIQKVQRYLDLPNHPDFDESNDDDEDERYKNGTWKEGELDDYELQTAVDWKFKRIAEVQHPTPGDSYSYDEWKAGRLQKSEGNDSPDEPTTNFHGYYPMCLEKDFRNQGLQVIVKLASVELTPEKPSYEGGSWHLEGMLNEHIVGTAIYYYDVENITSSAIDFRMEAELDELSLGYEQDVHEPLATVFGTKRMRDEPAIQFLGTLQCKQDRMIAFPNTLQHRVQPFKLQDPSRSGHRRFLVLWLVDPTYRIASTANVPPQQHDWLAPETIDKILAKQDLAAELEEMIREHTNDYPMSLETAKKLRLELMQERTKLMPHVERDLDSYNLCEH